MPNIIVGHYEKDSPWDCYVEDQEHQWILFVNAENKVVLYTKREKTGAVASEPLFDKESFPDFQKE